MTTKSFHQAAITPTKCVYNEKNFAAFELPGDRSVEAIEVSGQAIAVSITRKDEEGNGVLTQFLLTKDGAEALAIAIQMVLSRMPK